MLIYLILGASFMGFMDVLASLNPSKDAQFNNWERILGILIWPIFFIMFVYNLIKNKPE